jgi:uncharacterized protein YbbC (DUF1343 family)
MIRTGLDVLLQHRKKLLANKRLGLVANPSSVDGQLRFLVDLFLAEKSWKVVSLFGPEHGLRGELQDQEIASSFHDSSSGLPVHSLYGQNLKPAAEMLRGIDAMVFDIQDVGSRYYTFIYTLSYIMEACKEANVEVVVLDRPNPINGKDIEGPVLEKGFESFVGRFPLPTRHGMTVGELAFYFHQELGLNCKLEVVKMDDWRRDTFFEQTGLPWVLPSPNMPTVDSAIVYPGMCLLEGTNVSEGRGTTRPFEVFGAPWINPDILTRHLDDFRLPGVRFRPLFFQPTFNKFARKLCGGAQMHITDRNEFRPVKTVLCLLSVLLKACPDFRWKDPPYEFVTDRLPIDILWGNSWIRKDLEAGMRPDDIEEKWQALLDEFRQKRQHYLLYE